MKIKQIYFSEVQIEKLQEDADKRDIKFSELVRRILDDYLEKRNKDKVC